MIAQPYEDAGVMLPLEQPEWPCGHLKTPENTQSVGVNNGVRCRICRQRISRENKRRRSEARLINPWRV